MNFTTQQQRKNKKTKHSEQQKNATTSTHPFCRCYKQDLKLLCKIHIQDCGIRKELSPKYEKINSPI